jgi:hypothetical protein
MDQAREHLEFAQALGYGTKKDFEKMYAQLNEIRDKTADNKFGTGWFAKIKTSIEDFLKSSQPKNALNVTKSDLGLTEVGRHWRRIPRRRRSPCSIAMTR